MIFPLESLPWFIFHQKKGQDFCPLVDHLHSLHPNNESKLGHDVQNLQAWLPLLGGCWRKRFGKRVLMIKKASQPNVLKGKWLWSYLAALFESMMSLRGKAYKLHLGVLVVRCIYKKHERYLIDRNSAIIPIGFVGHLSWNTMVGQERCFLSL